ncbi:hypothetical protein SAMN05216387_1197 [Nitrosovibrio tenuis]|uniref:Uncharacterized protein n=1 Tax=Nitrosovibrio tenuis TaxID=1233 RepID=A0A1H7RSC3_9PROT|nr:hypothetical protein SAMN05216387_1197 [Nitrosovibrio tenuis]
MSCLFVSCLIARCIAEQKPPGAIEAEKQCGDFPLGEEQAGRGRQGGVCAFYAVTAAGRTPTVVVSFKREVPVTGPLGHGGSEMCGSLSAQPSNRVNDKAIVAKHFIRRLEKEPDIFSPANAD